MLRNLPLVLLALAALQITVTAAQAALAPGAEIPAAEVKMKNVDGKSVSINDIKGKKGTLVVFSCNHCPWARAWEERTVQTGNAALGQGVGVIMINSNDPANYPEDGFDAMVQRAQARGMKFPYVVDDTSDVARAFGASRTPEYFLFDAEGKLVYTGALDDNADDPFAVRNKYLQAAIDAVLAGQPVPVSVTKSVGCSIKFRGKK